MQLVDRVLKAMEILSREEAGMSVSELSAALGIPQSSTHRVLKSLQDNHFVLQNQETRKYSLSYKVYTLCSGMREQNSLVILARPHMRSLAKEIRKTVVLCVMSGDKIMNLDCIESGDSAIYMVKIGREMPLYSTSAGRVFAAYMESERAGKILENTIRTKETPYTKTDLKELLLELEKIRRDGYSVIDEELQLGIQGVSCPVFDSRGNVAAALAMTTMKTEDLAMEKLIDRLKLCAEQISQELL